MEVQPRLQGVTHRLRGILISRLMVWALALASVGAHGAVRISEFMAENDGFHKDADGDSPDWIELQNDSAATVNLAGWHLTDDPADLAKWTFPATNLPAGGYLVVFASGKDRAVAGAELHTNFQLDNAGEYLALVAADGTTVVSAFSPQFPPQRANVSYGFGSSNTPPIELLASGSSARWFVPTNGALGDTWISPAFDDSSWNSAATPLRYDVTVGGTPVLSLDFNDRENDTAANTQTGYSSFVIGSVGSTTAIQTGPIARTYGSLSVTLSNSAAGIGYDDRFRTTPANGGTLTLEDIFRDFVFSRELSGTSGLDLFVSGLVPGQLYGGTVWSFDSGSPRNRISDWFANGMLVTNNYTFNGSTLPTADSANRFTFQAAADASGGLLVSGRRDTATGANDFAVFLNALQLTPLGATATNGNLAAMSGRNGSVFVRQSFTVMNPSAFNQLTLRVRYDDGFVAYLNGTEVARRNAPATPPWDAVATAPHAAGEFEEMVFPNYGGLLWAGTNVLAFHGLNAAADDAEFLIEAQLLTTVNTEYAGRFFAPPTPGTANGFGYEGLVADTKFSVDRGFYDTPFSLSITCATAGAEIRWTTNGSAPTPTSGTLYTAPLLVTNTTFLRAAAFLPGYVPSDVDTHTYLFLSQVLRQSATQPGYPTAWQGSYPADYEMDPNIVNSARYGPTLSNDLRSIPTLSLVTEHLGLWSSSTGIYPNATSVGASWERAASVELILPEGTNGSTAFAVNCGVRMQGNASRDNARTPKHAFRLLFKSGYGPAKLRYEWFPDSPVRQFDNIVLRAGFCDTWSTRYSDTTAIPGGMGTRYRPEDSIYIRDTWMKDSQLAMGWHSARNNFVHLYINGLYWGLYNPCERMDASHFTEYFGGREMDWDVLSGDATYDFATLKDGTKDAWNELMALVNAGITNEVAYQAVQQLVDVDQLIDFMLLHFHGEAEDWPHHNWYVARRRPTNDIPATKWFITVWDQEIVCDQLVARNRIEVNNADTPARIYGQLRAWPEFRVRFGDRVHRHLFNGGALTASNCVRRLDARAAQIDRAIVGESARWGDAREFAIGANPATGKTFTRDEWWVPELQKLCTNWFPRQQGITLERLRTAGLYPPLGAPEFNQFGGGVPAGFSLAMLHTNATGTIFFTVDGSDPRTYGTGVVAPTAQAYATPVTLNAPMLARARVLTSGQWSALVEAMFYPPQDLSRLALTEIMFNPPAVGVTNGDDFEFIELKNTGTNMLNLSGLAFTAGISFQFTNGTLLAPGEFFVLVRTPAAFLSMYPSATVGGVFSGKLDNGGERLTLSHPVGPTVWSVTYDDTAPWPATADNFGFSLVQRSGGVTQAPDDGSRWRASAFPGGSPGADDPQPDIPPIVINEVLTASVLPQVDAIELFNPTSVDADISGWFLTDDPNLPRKFRIPDGTIIPASGFAVFDESQFNPTPGTNNSFALNARGDDVYLFSAAAAGHLTGYSHGFSFAASDPGVSFGRYVDSTGEEHFPAQLALSLTNANADPRVGPVVINEIHYHPETNGDEFVELRNLTTAPVELFDLASSTNTWRLNGLGYLFPTNLTLEPGGLLLLVATNPADFRVKYAVPENVLVLGPYSGALQDSGERLTLERPAPPNTNGPAWIVVDEVRYNDKAPWSPAADGSGPSLQRINSAAYGNDPINWGAAAPTPGQPNSFPELDTDADGMPDSWELANGTRPYMADADADPDGDGYTNAEEYQAGTHPLDPLSRLTVDRITVASEVVTLEFLAASNRTYTILAKDSLGSAAWMKLADVTSQPTQRLVIIPDAVAQGVSRFYRLVTPAWP